MQGRKIFLFVLCCLFLGVGYAQEIRERADGEKIIVYPDGSWRYFNDPVDVRYTADGASEAFPVFDGEVAPLDGAISVTEQDLYKIAQRKQQLAEEASRIARIRATQATKNRIDVEQEYRLAQDRNYSQSKLQHIQVRLEAARRTEEQALLDATAATGQQVETETLIAKGAFVEDYKAKRAAQSRQAALNAKRIEHIQRNNALASAILTPFSVGNQRSNLILNPPDPTCQVAFAAEKNEYGQQRFDTPQQLLFSYTDDRLRPYLKDKDYLRCEGFFSGIGGYRYLSLSFTFAYPNAREAYGIIEEGSILTIKMLNGEFVNLRSGKMDEGAYDTETGLLTYKVHYPINGSQMNLLRSTEVDKIRVFWSSGYEEYPVYELDFFINQINCLEQ